MRRTSSSLCDKEAVLLLSSEIHQAARLQNGHSMAYDRLLKAIVWPLDPLYGRSSVLQAFSLSGFFHRCFQTARQVPPREHAARLNQLLHNTHSF